MVGVAALLNVLLRPSGPGAIESLIVQIFGAAFLPLLALHLRNTNQDRRAAFARKDVLLRHLGFAQVHGNVMGIDRPSAPTWMVRFAGSVATFWGIWPVVSLVQFVRA